MVALNAITVAGISSATPAASMYDGIFASPDALLDEVAAHAPQEASPEGPQRVSPRLGDARGGLDGHHQLSPEQRAACNPFPRRG
jgi:hypothetical protein